MNDLHNRLLKNPLYKKWHAEPHNELGHWGVFVLIALFATSHILGQINVGDIDLTASVGSASLSGADERSDLATLNRELLNGAREHATAVNEHKPEVLARVTALAQKRKQLLADAMEHNPSAVLNAAISEQLQRDLPPGIAALLERSVALEGELEVIHIHYGKTIESSTSEDFYNLTDAASGKKYRLRFAGELPSAVTGAKLKLKGVALGDEVAVNTTDSTNFEVLSTASLTAPTTLKKVAVIMLNFQDNTATPWSADQVRQSFFTNSNSASAYYTETSFGKWAFTGKNRSDGDVFGWYTVPYSASVCNYSAWSSSANTQAQAAGFDPSGYSNVVYVFPGASCGWIGLAYVGGPISYLNNTISGLAPTHELGHNYGLQHANTYSCTENGARVSISGSCTSSEYADPFDTMGNISRSHLNAYSKGRTGTNFYDAGGSVTVAYPASTLTTETYTITPLEMASPGIKALRIPRDPSSVSNRTFYYLEFRQPSAMDAFSPSSPVVNGVSIRLAYDYNLGVYSQLIDATPETGNFSDSALPVGRTFTDAAKGISVKTLSVSPSGATVEVTLTPAPCTRANPSLGFNGGYSGYPGQTFAATLTIKNNDSFSCSASTFTVTPTLPAGWVQTPLSFTETLSAGSSVTRTLNITSALTSTPGSYTLSERAVNTVNAALTGTASFPYLILAPDSTAPQVKITKPLTGTKVGKGKVQVSATASDASDISKIVLMLDGAALATCTNKTSCSSNVSANSLSSGTHTITAVATDKSSQLNSSSASVVITK